ncbi:hypothetical protein ACFFKU_04095 [Kineococcus gynurae]|uniref:DUF2975 family protein n=1 Tax=Kineococcus gynurae TaxID=452979 RepID=A0ABV5LRL1_9ACTN
MTGRRYLGAGWFELARVALVLGGLGAAVGGVGYAVNGATQAPAGVAVGVLAPPGTTDVRLPVDLPAAADARLRNSGAEDGAVRVDLRAWDATGVENALARGSAALVGLAVGVGALLLLPVLDSVARGEAFAHRRSRRLALLAGVVALAATLHALPGSLAAGMVLDRLGLTGLFLPPPGLDLSPWLLVAGALLATAEAFRRREAARVEPVGAGRAGPTAPGAASGP